MLRFFWFILAVLWLKSSIAQTAWENSHLWVGETFTQPLALIMGEAKKDLIEPLWQQKSLVLKQTLLGDVTQSQLDNQSPLINPKVMLYDLELGKEKEDPFIKQVRFGLFEDTLYLVRFTLQDSVDFLTLYQQIASVHGKHHRASRFGYEYFEWQLGSILLAIQKGDNDQTHRVILLHEPLARKVWFSHQSILIENKDKIKF